MQRMRRLHGPQQRQPHVVLPSLCRDLQSVCRQLRKGRQHGQVRRVLPQMPRKLLLDGSVVSTTIATRRTPTLKCWTLAFLSFCVAVEATLVRRRDLAGEDCGGLATFKSVRSKRLGGLRVNPALRSLLSCFHRARPTRHR